MWNFKFDYLIYILILVLMGCSKIVDPEPAGETTIVLTFDDNHQSIFENAYPIMQEFGYTGTNYIYTAGIDEPERLTLSQLHELETAGWETGGHTVNHANLTDLSIAESETEIKNCWLFLKENNLDYRTFALPSGHANQETLDIIKTYFHSIRSSEDFKMKCPLDGYSLGYYDARNTDGSEKVIARILSGIANHECLVIIGFHRIIADKESHSRAVTPQEFREILSFIQDRNLPVMTISQALTFYKV